MKKNFLSGLLPCICTGLLLSCSGGEKKQEETVSEKVKVKTTVAKMEQVERIATYTATVKADVVNKITPALPGRIEKIYVEIGDRVQKGQLLAKMDGSTLKQQTIQLANLERDYARNQELLAVGGIAQQTVDGMKAQIDALKTAINNLDDNTELRSPVAGTITARNYDNGDMFGQLPILTVEQINPVKAIINISETYFTKVKLGMDVEIKLDVYGDEIFAGKATLIYPTVDAASHTFGVEVTINNSALKVRPGMYARVYVNFGTVESIVVPDRAVIKQSGANDKYVFTVESGVARYHKVEPGQRIGEHFEIISGLNDGDIVVTDGQTRLIDGSEVETVNN
ncbi:MAG: efflux RND transporter periplasmic adaptor subunit [Dysgonamonadaceae bacterium]|jgi:RND family efflux transporter MFP subunit|nr:efflux RND transporter periplasmic adaptor subunit [Dysgonamonadaceae bacterium]